MPTENEPQTTPPPAPPLDDDEVTDPGFTTLTPAPAPAARQQPAPPAKPTHSARLLAMAEDAQITRAEAEDMTQDELLGAIRLFVRQQNYLREQFMPRAAEPAPRPQPQPEPEPEIDWGTDADGRRLAEDEIHPAIARQIKALHKRNARLEEAVVRDHQNRAAMSRAERQDAAFAALAADYGDRLGEGDYTEIEPGSKQFKARVAVNAAAAIDWSRNPSARAVAKAYREAAEALFGGKATAAKGGGTEEDPYGQGGGEGGTRNPPRPRAANGQYVKPAAGGDDDDDEETKARKAAWMNGGLPQPTSRKSPADGLPKGRDRAVQSPAVREQLMKMGLPVDAPNYSREEREVLETLPD